MTITTREVSHVTIVDLNGRITLGDETGKLRDTVRELISAGKKKIVLNLAHVDYIDSSGVGELVSSFTAVRNAGGELKLLSLTKKVQDVLYVTKLYTVFDIKDDEFTAVKSFDYFFANKVIFSSDSLRHPERRSCPFSAGVCAVEGSLHYLAPRPASKGNSPSYVAAILLKISRVYTGERRCLCGDGRLARPFLA